MNDSPPNTTDLATDEAAMAAAAAAAIAESAAADAAAAAAGTSAPAGSAGHDPWQGSDPVRRGRSRSESLAERGGRHRPWSGRGGRTSHWWAPNGARGEDSTALPTLTADLDEKAGLYDSLDDETPTPYSSAALYGDTAAYATIAPKEPAATASRLRVPITLAEISPPAVGTNGGSGNGRTPNGGTGNGDPARGGSANGDRANGGSANGGHASGAGNGASGNSASGNGDSANGRNPNGPGDRDTDPAETLATDIAEESEGTFDPDRTRTVDDQTDDALADGAPPSDGTPASGARTGGSPASGAAEVLAGAAATVGTTLAIPADTPSAETADAGTDTAGQVPGSGRGAPEGPEPLTTGVLAAGSLIHRGPDRRTVGLASRPPVAASTRRRKLPRRPAVALTAMVLFGLLSGFFAWISAEPFWLAVGHSEAGMALVTECDGTGLSRHCYASFTDRDGIVVATRATLVGARGHQLEPASTMTARMVGANGRIAYVGTDEGLRARGAVGLVALLLCGVLLAWLSGAGRLPTRANRTVAYLISMVGPLLLFAGMCAATW